MFFHGIIVLFIVAMLVITICSDATTGKKEKSFFKSVQKPSGKEEREITISEFDQYDHFYLRLNGQ